MKYQFCIQFKNTIVNSAATKAVLDANAIFSKNGYQDFTLTVVDNADGLKYYKLLLKELMLFLFAVKKGSVIGIQYPLLSINKVFKYFINTAKLKGIRFYCVVHDLESLRTGGKDKALIDKEISYLNHYDGIIAHNPHMINWLQEMGLNNKIISLKLFDYLCDDFTIQEERSFSQKIVFAGNLNKSSFIYSLGTVKKWKFNVYGPYFNQDRAEGQHNLYWRGEYSPEEIVRKLNGCFGLIWDGDSINKCDEVLGNYLNYNNPHKFSLYIAAGLPVIAPASAAIASFIQEHQIGLLVNNLYDLDSLQINEQDYSRMRSNVMHIRSKVISGYYLTTAIRNVETLLTHKKEQP
jgi:hypothetical protein